MNEENYYSSDELNYKVYNRIIRNKKKEVELLNKPPKDVTSFLREEDGIYFYGLCDHEIQSTSFMKKCPFDKRHQSSIWNKSKTKGMTCRLYCYIEDFKRNCQIKKMNDVPIEHREKLRQLIKYKLLDFIPKV